jgi:hypothetical protein
MPLIRPLSKFALLEKTDNFGSESSANFEGISKDMTEKFDVEADKKCCFNEQMDFRKRSIYILI